ncbi:MAG TPA: UPF0182 family protein, partial [Longimicrobiales bacterium]|nr:UPF0182 family protein [Longimicrobiales bacterium]
MSPKRRGASLRGGRLVVVIVVALGVLIALGRAVAAAYVEVLWQLQAGYTGVFWRRMLWEWGTRALAGVVIGALVAANLRVAATTLGGIQIRRRFGNIEIAERIPRRLVWWGILSAGALLGLWFGAAVPANLGLHALLVASGGPWGLEEPILGHDVGFYVFWVPLLHGVITFSLIVTFLVFTLVTAAYAATGTIRWVRGRLDAQELPRVHLGAVVAVFLVLLAARLWLQRYMLLTDGSSAVQGMFGFADAEARLPALQTLTVICLAAAGGVLWGAIENRSAPVLASLAAVIAGALVIGQLYPRVVQRIRVQPNELARETPYIEHHLAFTRIGFGLDELERRHFVYTGASEIDWDLAARQIAGVPVWSRGAVLATFRALEALFPYYDFDEVTVDRYPTPSGPVPVAISVRQVDRSGIQEPNWQNQHLRKRYVAGAGAVAAMAAARTLEGRPQMLLTGIPPEVTRAGREVLGLEVTRPEIFFGTAPQEYAVVNPGPEPYLAPDSTPGKPGRDYPVGIPLTSGLRTALLAWHFGDPNLLFASELTDRSRLIYRRLAVDRAHAIAPFLRFPEPPYPVVSDGRVVWVLEGFTGTNAFPLSASREFGAVPAPVRYARNSVKVTVDAVTGRVDFYRVPVRDPLADAYERAFPGLFRPMSEMPEDLRAHLRYPRALLSLQSSIMLQYHQESPAAFHGQQDVWAEPDEVAEGASPAPYRAEYALFTLPGEEGPRFHLTTVFVPAARQNLTGILVGRTDERGVPELILLDVPVADQVPGPRQVEALVEQDPEISQQFSLWRTGGREVWTGHLHLLPV